MATGDVTFHNKFLNELGLGNENLAGGTYRLYLLDGAEPDIDADDFLSDVIADEIPLTGYTAGGATLSSLAYTRDDTNDYSWWDFANPNWASIAAGTITWGVIVRWTGSAATSVIVCHIEVDDSNGQSYTVTIPATGIVHVQQAA